MSCPSPEIACETNQSASSRGGRRRTRRSRGTPGATRSPGSPRRHGASKTPASFDGLWRVAMTGRSLTANRRLHRTPNLSKASRGSCRPDRDRDLALLGRLGQSLGHRFAFDFGGMTSTPSRSPKMRSPGAIRTPSISIRVRKSITLPRGPGLRVQSARERGKAERLDPRRIPDEAIEHSSCGAQATRSSRHQFAPQRISKEPPVAT